MSKLINPFWESDGVNPDAWDSNALDNTESDTFNIGSANDCNSLFFKPDGTKMYICIYANYIREYDLSTAWDITSASLNQTNNTHFTINFSQGLSFRESDGKKMYTTINQVIDEWDLSTGWDISTISVSDTFSYVTKGTGVFVRQSDGEKLYRVNETTDLAEEFDMSTGWDLTTAAFNQTLDISTEAINPQDLSFKPDGTKMYIAKGSTGIRQYTLSTAWDISSATWDTITTNTLEGNGMYWKPDGEVMYMGDIQGDVKSYLLA